MSEAITDSATAPSCAVPQPGASGPPTEGSLLSGGCCSGEGPMTESAEMGRGARRARAIAGFGFLALAGAMSSRQFPGRISLWPAAIVPTWFGVSHLVAGVTGYRGCPELGAIPSVMLDRPVGTACGPWERIDSWIEGSSPPGSASGC
jgi:hypothetical protein